MQVIDGIVLMPYDDVVKCYLARLLVVPRRLVDIAIDVSNSLRCSSS